MRNYEFHNQLKAIYDKAVETYAGGGRNVNTFFDGAEVAFLRSIGAIPMEIYDFAEDFNGEGEPDWETVLVIQTIRRDYFLQVQGGKHSATTLREPDFPAREDEVRGVAWLPRLMLKAKSKLRGEMPADLMYCCGGDRNFFRTRDIHPAEFLHLTWHNMNNDEAIIDWVLNRKAESGAAV